MNSHPIISTMRFVYLALVTFFITSCISTPAPSPTLTPEPEVNAVDANLHLARTVNLGNALEAPKEGEWGVVLKEEFFPLIRQRGFTAVRLPVRWSAHALNESPYTIDPEFFKRVDWAIEQALANDLTIVVNMHHYEEMALDPEKHQARFLMLWQQISEHYRSYPNTVLFEPMNEPNGLASEKIWNNIISELLPVIRTANPNRNIVIGPANWNDLHSLDELILPVDDRHIIVTFHYYNPFQFTHQGAEWVQGSIDWLGKKWSASSAQKQSVQYDFNIVEKWSSDNQRPIFLGEFGAYSKADLESRTLWTSFVAQEAESRGFSWGYWEFCSGFGLYNLSTSTWNEELAQALIPPQ